MRLAILETDVLRDELRPRYEGYGRMFVELFERIGSGWEMEIFSVIRGEYPESFHRYDAFLVTGSQHDAFDDADWILRLKTYLHTLYRQAVPLVGICFGHQLLAHALGGKADRAEGGWGLGVMTFQVQTPAPFLDSEEPVKLIMSHRDQVLKIPENTHLLLSNDFCPFAAFYRPDRLLALQGHPEFGVDYARALLAFRADQISPTQRAQVEASFEVAHQGERVGLWIKRFLEQAV